MKIISYLLTKYSSIMAGKKKISVPLAEKKRYCEMIKKGVSGSTVSEFYRKKHGDELAERTWRSSKADCKSMWSTMLPILFWKKKTRNHLSSTFFLFKLTMRKLERKWTLKNKLLFKFPRKKRAKPRKNNSKSRAFLITAAIIFRKIPHRITTESFRPCSQRKTGIKLENF